MAPWEIWTYDFEDETHPVVIFIYYVPKAKLRERRGLVSTERRRAVSQTLLRFFPFTP